jgi:hypothetical protein
MRRRSAAKFRRVPVLRGRAIAPVAAFVLLALGLAASGARAAEKQIGQSCSSDNSSIDWDTIAQCNNTSFVSGPLILGAMTNPPYSATTCTSTNAGMVQWTGSSFEFCNGASWAMAITATGSVGIGTTSPTTTLDVKGSGTGEIEMGEAGWSNAYAAIGLANSVSIGNYNLASSPGDTNLYINRPTGSLARGRRLLGKPQHKLFFIPLCK